MYISNKLVVAASVGALGLGVVAVAPQLRRPIFWHLVRNYAPISLRDQANVAFEHFFQGNPDQTSLAQVTEHMTTYAVAFNSACLDQELARHKPDESPVSLDEATRRVKQSKVMYRNAFRVAKFCGFPVRRSHLDYLGQAA